MIRFKGSTVHPGNLIPQIVLALILVEPIFKLEGRDTIITSLNDSKHKRSSLHYLGAAVDLRSHHLPEGRKEPVLDLIRERLGPDYDVLLEGRETPNEHFHIEWDPKRGTPEEFRV